MGVSDAVSVAPGADHTCALKADRTVVCWGQNNYGQLGTGTTTQSNTARLVHGPSLVDILSDVTAISSGRDHTCALKGDGTVACWGQNDFGQLGNGFAVEDLPNPLAATVPGLAGVTAIGLGAEHTCALKADQTVACWGSPSLGQVGAGTYSTSTPSGFPVRPTPLVVSGVTAATALAVGGAHSCALVAGGTVKCWGDNSRGQLGNGSTTAGGAATPTPQLVGGLTDASQIVAGAVHTCARRTAGTSACWGDNYYGELGNGTTVNATSPQTVSGLPANSVLAAHLGNHSCALSTDSTARCWGANFFGALGNGTTVHSNSPQLVIGL